MHIQTKKQRQYFKKVIKLHYEKGYGEDRISRIIPTGHSTVSRWIAIFAAENGESPV
jgi:transposase